MLFKWSVLLYVLIPILLFLAWFAWDVLIKNKKFVKLLLFEKIGDRLMFKGVSKAFEKRSKRLGIYLINKKLGLNIDLPSEKRFIPGKNKKWLPVCQYSTDDWRVMSLLDETFFTEEEVPVFQEVEVPDPDNPSQTLIIKKPLKNKDGSVLTEVKKFYYEFPLGVDQNAREVARFNRSFHQEMEDFMSKTPGFWDKYGSLIINGMVIVAFMIFVIFLWGKNQKLQEEMMIKFDENSDGIVNSVSSEGFIDGLINKYIEKDTERGGVPLT